ncbi:MAG TPA: hypothetical protein P5234_14270 [Thermoanaerobaculaceae bacterium]|nr:hypothetical protein [Thermoanaerobaculaceae bacterium]HRS17396.1 hypothetical protein [Thermoanaerobaculaceae bacterium]
MIQHLSSVTTRLSILLALVASAAEPGEAPPCRILESVAPVPVSADLASVAIAPHLTVAVGRDGTILTSADRSLWSRQSSPTTADLAAVAYGAGRWVAVGAGGVVLTSTDGASWSLSPTGFATDLTAVTWGLGRFLAAGDDGLVATSSDAVNWRPTTLGESLQLTSLACGVAACVVVGVWQSPWFTEDGVHWAPASAPVSGWSAVAWDRGQFVAVGGRGVVLRSTDGRIWVQSVLPETPELTFIASNGSSWLTNGFRSPDAVTWTPTSPVPVSAVAGGAAGFVGVGRRGGIFTSPDGQAWDTPSVDPQAVASDGRSYTVLANGTATLWSADGRAWEPHAHASAAYLHRLIAWPGGYLALGNEESGPLRGVALLSPEGKQWGADTRVPLPYAVDVAFGGDTFVAVGTEGRIATSPDGITWSEQPSGTGASLSRVLWDGRQFLVQGAGIVLTSPDGRAWTPKGWTPPPGSSLALASGDELVAVGETVWLSRDGGVNWLEAAQDLPGAHLAAARVGAFLVTAGGYGTYDTPRPGTLGASHDGAFWRVVVEPEARFGLTGIAAGPGGFVTIGPFNTVMRGACEWSGAAVIPTVAHIDGARGSRWRSDLTIANPGLTRTTFSLELSERGRPEPVPRTAAFALDPGVSASYPDLVEQLFAFEGAGVLRIVGPPDAALPAHVRTYNQTPGGSFGQDVPVLADDVAIPHAVTAVLAGLAQSSDPAAGFRTNLGLVNVGDRPIEVVVRAFDSQGAALGQVTLPLGGRESRQLDRVLAAFASRDLAGASLWVHTPTPGGRFVAFASVIDNSSGDPTLVLAR